MGATDELMSARWHAALTVAQGPNSNNLEAVVKLITGIPFATGITNGLGLDAACRFAAAVRCTGSSTPGSSGIRLRDSTNSKEFLLQQIADELNLYQNTGTETTPVWSLIGQIAIAAVPSGAAVYEPYGSQDFRSTGALIDFTTERFDDGSFWSTAARSRLIVPSDGRYRVSYQVYIESPGSVVVIQLMAYLKVNGAAVPNTHQAAIIRNIQVGAPGIGVSGGVVYDGASANDYFEVFCLTVGGTPYDGTLTEASFSVEKVE